MLIRYYQLQIPETTFAPTYFHEKNDSTQWFLGISLLFWLFGHAACLKEMFLIKGELKCTYLSVTYGMGKNKQELKQRGRTFWFVLFLKAVRIIRPFSEIVHGSWLIYNENFFLIKILLVIEEINWLEVERKILSTVNANTGECNTAKLPLCLKHSWFTLSKSLYLLNFMLLVWKEEGKDSKN